MRSEQQLTIMNKSLEAIGLIVIHASHLEREIESLCTFFIDRFPRSECPNTAGTRKKIQWMQKCIKQLNTNQLIDLSKKLDKANNLLSKRNDIVHGQIFISDLPDQLICINERASSKQKRLMSSELFKLAEDINISHTNLSFGTVSKLVCAIYEEHA
ncbi:hypothetical protein [Parashewanella tropica]|uniref:hypothetical protein n=1 Tax=Parashewanella tropica TaxID=2547970 RepID=UPI001059F96C|nr:hypothetical protein [Parashewanella tropica]